MGKGRSKSGSKKKRVKKRAKKVPPPKTSPPPSKFRYQLPPTFLERVGPIIKGVIGVPVSIAEALRKAGKPVPPAVSGYMLIDTGATTTCIATDVCQELELPVIDKAHTYGAGGLHVSEVYPVRVEIHIQEGAAVSSVNMELPTRAVPDLSKHFGNLVKNGDKPARLVGLVGRDLLRHATLTYNGDTGEFGLEFHLNTLKPEPRASHMLPASTSPKSK